RCEECYSGTMECSRCIADRHAAMPFHRIVRWCESNGFWADSTLADAGVRVRLGHGGAPCPNAHRNPRKMTIGVESGYQSAQVLFCECVDRSGHLRTPQPIQLIQYGLFPTSWEVPMSAFSIRLHRAYHLLSLQAQTNARDFTIYLRRLTDNVIMTDTPDRYREFSISNREFVFLRAVRRAGEVPKRALAAGSLAVLCPACPQIDINMDPNWRTRPADQRFLDALFYGIDGNFHQNQKVKPLDPNDFALTLGAAYFANAEDFTKYQKTLGPMEPEPSTCHKFAAMGLGGYWNNISGTLGVSCRHQVVLPGGGVDLQKGERFVNVDFALVSGLQRWMDLPLHVSGYDINCQYRINLDKRLAAFEKATKGMASVANKKFPPTIACVGKFHLPAHKPACQFKFSYIYHRWVGRTDGEAPERLWAVLNPLGTSTREMTAGHRHDRINDHHSDMNVRRVHGLATELARKHKEAVAGYSRTRETLDETEEEIPDNVLRDWLHEEEEFVKKVVNIKNHKKLHNPYEVSMKRGMLALECQERADQAARMLLLEILEDDFEGEKKRTEQMHAAFLARVEAWREMYALNLAPLIQVAAGDAGDSDAPIVVAEPGDSSDDEADEAGPTKAGAKRPAGHKASTRSSAPGSKSPAWHAINDIVIDLPTSRGPKTIAHVALRKAVEAEMELRKGEANDALDDLRAQIITNYGWRHEKKKNVKGVKRATKANRAIQLKQKAIDHAANRYRRARSCLISLGMDQKDPTYRVLRQHDKVSFNVFHTDDKPSSAKARNSKLPSWIWGDSSFVAKMGPGAVRNFCDEAFKVRWFRERAAMSRWHEEIQLLEEEMGRMLRYFEHYVAKWRTSADEHTARHERGMSAYARRQAHRHSRLFDESLENF
ncbi:hypothetical protein BV25DRAFT_1767553, partial [Artomyces pyxidatus]